jgi:dynein heavy chain, axonemal
VQGKGTTFVFSEQDVKEEAFLEYLNSVLSSGTVSNLFNKDEQSEIVMELIPVMKREFPRRPPTPENVLEYFLSRVRQNLHIALCFSPVGEKFRSRALKFPGLISGCTLDWLQPWPKEALIAVARHSLSTFPLLETDQLRYEVEEALGTIQESVAEISKEYFQRFSNLTTSSIPTENDPYTTITHRP